jgi:hypothetical protein
MKAGSCLGVGTSFYRQADMMRVPYLKIDKVTLHLE